MKNTFLLFLSIVLLFSCSSEKSRKGVIDQDIPFTEAKNYFVRNDAAALDKSKFETQQEFDSVFGMAATMNGKPTTIGFSKEFVVAQIEDPSNQSVDLKPILIHKNANILEVKYRKTVGATQSYMSQTAMIRVIDRKYDADVNLIQVD